MKKMKILLGVSMLALLAEVGATTINNDFDVGSVVNDYQGSEVLYEDKVGVTYVEKVVVHPKRSWVGQRVLKKDGICFEILNNLKIRTIKKPFENLKGASELPSEIKIGDMGQRVNFVNCDQYEAKERIID